MSLRILVLPNISAANPEGSSDFKEFYAACQELVELFDIYFIFAIPKRMDVSKIEKVDGIHLLQTKGEGFCFWDMERMAPEEFLDLFNERIGEYPVDAIWTTRSILAGYIALNVRDSRNGTEFHTPVFLSEAQPLGPMAIYEDRPDAEMMARILSYYAAIPIFLTEVELDRALAHAAKFCSGTVVQHIRKRALVDGSYADLDELYEAVRGVEKPVPLKDGNPFHLIHFGRLNQQKRVPDILGVYEYVRASGMDVKIEIITADKGKRDISQVKKLCPAAIVTQNPPPKVMYEHLAQAHCAIGAALSDSLPMSIEELFVAKVAVILPDRKDSTKAILGELYDSYPFKWRTWEEAYAMAKWIAENWTEAKKHVEHVSEMMMDVDDQQANTEWYYKLFTKTVADYEVRYPYEAKGIWEQPFLDAVKMMPDRFQIEDFQRALTLACRNFSMREALQPWWRGQPTRFGIYKFLKYYPGIRDTLTGPVPVFERFTEEK